MPKGRGRGGNSQASINRSMGQLRRHGNLNPQALASSRGISVAAASRQIGASSYGSGSAGPSRQSSHAAFSDTADLNLNDYAMRRGVGTGTAREELVVRQVREHRKLNKQLDNPQSTFWKANQEARAQGVIGSSEREDNERLNKLGNQAKHQFKGKGK